ncbi:MAG: UDP-4-amino-4,6-dideoxy-N-acetyl-beta-L-altrosamine transaminase [Deltaproteobacteria bacterium]|nr:UDP-4-amino-4,6-dideoxy-N-acetyl-beta-L-altrosamine transaminase [Deltaproteobacteria bacterium]
MRRTISYGRQTIDEDDIRAVISALRSDHLTQGPLCEEFEKAICGYTGARYAVACANGTAALHLACMAAGVGKGDSVITSPVTFLASANCAVYLGAAPLFADIDPLTFNISPDEVEKKLKCNSNVKAIIPVHFAGLPADMEAISKAARKRGIVIIEDACHALGALLRTDNGKWTRAGDCSHSDMTVFSFHPVKSITTGEGGAITTNDRKLYERLKTLRAHGVVKDPASFVNGTQAPWYYEMHSPGFNYRLSDVQCALGVSQMRKLDKFIERRRDLAALYSGLLSKYSFIKTQMVPDGRLSAFHLFPVRIPFRDMGVSKKEWFSLMDDLGIRLQVHYIPLHLQPFFQNEFGYRKGDFPAAEELYSEEVSLPIYPLLTDEEAGFITEAIISTIACAAASPKSIAREDRAGA